MDDRNQVVRPSDEIVERSFTIVKSNLTPGLLDQISAAWRKVKVEPIFSDFEKYHAYDLVDPEYRPDGSLPYPMVDIEQVGNYLTVQLHNDFLRALNPKPLNVPMAKIGNIRHNPYRSLITSPGAQGNHAEEDIKRNIEAFIGSMSEFNILAKLFERLEAELGLKSLKIKPSIFILTSYGENGTVFNECSDLPGHRDEAVTEKEVLVSIQLTPGRTQWIVGRDESCLEVVYQEQGDLVILDNFGQQNDGDPRRNPIHHVIAGPNGREGLLLSFTEHQHQRFLDFLNEFSPSQLWSPTPKSLRVPFTPTSARPNSGFDLSRQLTNIS